MLLPDHEIKALHHLLVRPWDESQVQPASIDLKLWNRFKVFPRSGRLYIDLAEPPSFDDLTEDAEVSTAFVLHPGEFVLAATEERVTLPNNIAGRVEGKSSLGRLGLIIHATAGFVDPGFRGQITLEMTNLLEVPIMLRPGLPICQLSLQYLNSPAENPYSGRYQDSEGVIASRYSG